jgi:hypothetical protein
MLRTNAIRSLLLDSPGSQYLTINQSLVTINGQLIVLGDSGALRKIRFVNADLPDDVDIQHLTLVNATQVSDVDIRSLTFVNANISSISD